MTAPVEPTRFYLPQLDLMQLSGVPAVFHCHHFNLFLDQTVDDAMGPDAGARLRHDAARRAALPLLQTLCSQLGAHTAADRLALAQDAFAQMGHGTLEIMADTSGGQALGSFLHYGYTWNAKYGSFVGRRHPADAFAAGFAAAAVEVAYDLQKGAMRATETRCIALRHPHCVLELAQEKPAEHAAKASLAQEPPELSAVQDGALAEALFEDRIGPVTTNLRRYLATVVGDQRGLVQAFGVFLTVTPSAYYNQISYDSLHMIQREAPQSVPVLELLLRESGHVCVFYSFGGILLSPEWEALVEPLTNDVEVVVAGCMSIARALGFGRWMVSELIPGERLVLRTPITYESAYYGAHHGMTDRDNEYFLQGAALAIAQLAHRVDWDAKPLLTKEFYDALFRGGNIPWTVEQTQSVACGDAVSEVVVSRVR